MNAVPHYFDPAPHSPLELTADLCVYGGVSGGVIAAIAGSLRGLSVVLLEPSAHLGGVTAGGLGMTDIGNKQAIGGLAREFYRRVGRRYGVEEDWRFEPSVAEGVLNDWLAETSARVFFKQFLESVQKEGDRIVAIQTASGLTVKARMFIDATYEGDLMAAAGVSHRIGRESNSVYSETLNGQQVRDLHQFETPVDPYIVPGVPASGVLPGIAAGGICRTGEGDLCTQAYNFRMCMTNRPDIRMPFPKPPGYNPDWYLLLKRFLATGWNEVFLNFNPVRNGKTDTNNHGAVSTDFIGMNHAYPGADYLTRERIFQEHVAWQQGLMWCMANDRDIPDNVREPMREWGLCRDEFEESGGWPHALYVREARRMVSDYVMTEHHCVHATTVEDAAGMAAYGMDSHHCRRIIVDGAVMNEGDVQVKVYRPYPISYRSLVPKAGECGNLFVTFCLSSSHIAFGSIRMEPIFMVLSHAAAIAADLAIQGKCAVQDLPYETLKKEFLGAGLVLSTAPDVVNTVAHDELVVA